jgi:hypothetical protein
MVANLSHKVVISRGNNIFLSPHSPRHIIKIKSHVVLVLHGTTYETDDVYQYLLSTVPSLLPNYTLTINGSYIILSVVMIV